MFRAVNCVFCSRMRNDAAVMQHCSNSIVISSWSFHKVKRIVSRPGMGHLLPNWHLYWVISKQKHTPLIITLYLRSYFIQTTYFCKNILSNMFSSVLHHECCWQDIEYFLFFSPTTDTATRRWLRWSARGSCSRVPRIAPAGCTPSWWSAGTSSQTRDQPLQRFTLGKTHPLNIKGQLHNYGRAV